jgi:hypothetical protein
MSAALLSGVCRARSPSRNAPGGAWLPRWSGVDPWLGAWLVVCLLGVVQGTVTVLAGWLALRIGHAGFDAPVGPPDACGSSRVCWRVPGGKSATGRPTRCLPACPVLQVSHRFECVCHQEHLWKFATIVPSGLLVKWRVSCVLTVVPSE